MELSAAYDPASIERLEPTLLPPLIEKVRIILSNSYNVTFPPEFTPFLARSLRVKDYDVERAALFVRNFSRCTLRLQDMLDYFEPKLCKGLYTNGTFTVLKSRDSLGRQVILSRVGNWDLKAHDFEQAASAIMLLFGFTVGESVETQRKGVVVIHDLSGFSIRHVKAMKPSRLTQLVGSMEDGAPGRIKGVHMIFHPSILGLVYRLIRPFLKEKLANRIHFHGDDLNSLHQHFEVGILPASLGGKLGEDESADMELIEKLMKASGIQKQLKSYGVFPY